MKVVPEDRSRFNSGINARYLLNSSHVNVWTLGEAAFTPSKRHFQRDKPFPELKDSFIPVVLGNIYVTLHKEDCANLLYAQRQSKKRKKADSSKL